MKNFKIVKFIYLIFLIGIAATQSARAFQNDDELAVPKVEDVQKIETTNKEFRFQTPESLLRQLPHLTAVTTGNGKFSNYQYGTILLKDGTILKWRSSSYGNVFLYNDKTERLYVEDTSIWSAFLGKFVYTLASFALFALLLIFYFDRLRHQPDDGSVNSFNRIMLIRVAAFLLLAFLGYLLLLEPFQQISDGRALSEMKGRSGLHITFADSAPIGFWFAIFLNAVFGLLSIFFGTILLLINPKSEFWKRKPPSKVNIYE